MNNAFQMNEALLMLLMVEVVQIDGAAHVLTRLCMCTKKFVLDEAAHVLDWWCIAYQAMHP